MIRAPRKPFFNFLFVRLFRVLVETANQVLLVLFGVPPRFGTTTSHVCTLAAAWGCAERETALLMLHPLSRAHLLSKMEPSFKMAVCDLGTVHQLEWHRHVSVLRCVQRQWGVLFGHVMFFCLLQANAWTLHRQTSGSNQILNFHSTNGVFLAKCVQQPTNSIG